MDEAVALRTFPGLSPRTLRAILLSLVALATACVGPAYHSEVPLAPRETPQSDASPTTGRASATEGQSIVVCGQAFPIGAPVVLFTDPDGFDARRTEPHFGPVDSKGAPPSGKLRYQPGRKDRDGRVLVLPGSRDLDELREVVDQFVLHYDVAGTSARCFRILQDVRGLSVHFMLDLDGTLYQTLDLRDQAWHASAANPRSIGIEIANMGAYPPGKTPELDAWSTRDAQGLKLVVPEPWRSRIRTRGFEARPARPERVRGRIHGSTYEMLDLTREQYDTLVKLSAALCRIFPRIEPDAPRDGGGRVRMDVLSDAELAVFGGIVGHHHLTKRKIDPGPAFQWEAFLARVRSEPGQPTP